MKHSKLIIIILIVIILNVLIRIPTFPHQQGMDTYYIQSLSKYIQEQEYIKWNHNPLSLIGLFPFSYPLGIPVLLTQLSSLINIDIENIILIFSIVITIFGLTAMSAFVKEYSNDGKIMLYSIIIFSIAPLFYYHSLWTITTRTPFITLIPIMLWLLLKYEKTKLLKYLISFIIIMTISSLIHRMFILALFVIPSSYIIAKVLIKYREKYGKKYLPLLITILIIFFLIQFTNLGPYKTYKWTYLDGVFFNAGTVTDYRMGSLNNFMLASNMVVDYSSNIGITAIFIPIYLIFIFKKINSKQCSFSEIFILSTLTLSVPFLINGYYTSFFLLPILALYSGCGFHIFINFFKKNLYKYVAVTLFIIGSLIFAKFMVNHWLEITQIETTDTENIPWIADSAINSLNFVENQSKHSNILVSDFALNKRLRAYSDNYLIPTNKDIDIELVESNILNLNEFDAKIALGNILTPSKVIININNLTSNSERNDWEKLITSNVYRSNDILLKYQLGYVLENKNSRIIKPKWQFYQDIESSQPKIYDNNKQEIWSLQTINQIK